VYRRFHIPVIILLPLLDNLIVAGTLYKVRLQTTGWIEVTKSILFLILFVYYY
jgi:sensor histidine kinase YesM